MRWKLFRRNKVMVMERNNNSILKWILCVIEKAKWLVGILVLLQAMLSITSVVFAFVLRRIINVAVAGAMRNFWIAIALLVGILLLQTLLSAVNRFVNEYTETVIENGFKQRLFSALLNGRYASVTAVHSGEWMNRLTSDTMIVAEGVTQIVPGMISMLVKLIGALSAILWLESHKSARLKRNNFSNFCNVGFAGAMKGAYLFGIVFCGHGILTGTMSYGNLMAIIQLIGQVQNPVANITGFLPRYYSMLASAERLMEAENFETNSRELISEKGVREFYRKDLRAIHLKDICFTYQPLVQTKEVQVMPVVLKHIDLTIRKGEYIAFTGPSGCGKSTLLKLLMCLYPLDSGEQILETKMGTQNFTEAWRRLFAYVPQGNQLLSGTIREIVTFGDLQKENNEENIYRALQIACADEFVRKLDKGLDTLLGEKGTGLSEGQMQRIAIARAVFSEHPILILDEATSALDKTTAIKLLKNLRKMTDRTVLLVTHRIEQIEIFDKTVSFFKEGSWQISVTDKKEE